MIDVSLILLGISFVLFFGFFAEFVFKKLHVPDILFLILLGFIVGPSVLDYIQPSQLSQVAPLFTTFALFFLVYDGAFNISLCSLAKGLKKGMEVTMYNFIVSVAIVSIIIFFFTRDPLVSLLAGFAMGGISSAFVIPILNELGLHNETYSILTLESTLTDVFTIVFSLAVMDVIMLQTFDVSNTLSKLLLLFGIAILVGILAAIVWIIAVKKVFKENKSYMITIAYLILVYVTTEFLHGSGVVAALFFGFVLRNSRQLASVASNLMQGHMPEIQEEACAIEESGVAVISSTERFFYSQISFFLKTFFFVYIGLLFDISLIQPIAIGFAIAFALMVARISSKLLTGNLGRFDRNLIASTSARGLAAAAVVQQIVINNIEHAALIVNVTYSVIIFTIVLSSVNIFLSKNATGKASIS